MVDLLQQLRAGRAQRRAIGAERVIPLGQPTLIAPREDADLVGRLRAARQARRLQPESPPPAPSRPAEDQWVVYVAQPQGALPEAPPVRIVAPNRWEAEARVSRATRVREDLCFAMPAYPELAAHAVPLDRHPLRKADPGGGRFDLDAMMLALRAQTARAEHDTARIEEFLASLRSTTGDRADTERPAPHPARPRPAGGGRARTRAERAPRPVDVGPDGPSSAAARRVLTDRQRELLAMVDVDEAANRVTYAPDEHLSDWRVLKQVVETLGGVWRSRGRGGKGGWIFPPEIDAVEAIALARETGEIFDPKLVGYYPTPDALADALVEQLDIRPGERVLEPSAGEGALTRAVRRACPGAEIVCVELLKPHVAALKQQGFTTIAGDFLKLGLDDFGAPFDVIVMNPPYGGSSRPEIRHVLHALELLKTGGRLGAILPNSLRYRQDASTVALRSELEHMGAVIEDNPRGAFQASGTMVRTVSVWCTLTTRSMLAEAGA